MRRSPRQSGEQGGFGEGEVARLLVEVDLGRCAHAVGALAEEYPVQVERQDLLLREGALEPQCEEHFLQLASQRSLGGQHGIACELHRDRPAALQAGARRDVRRHGPHQPLPVHAGMLEKAVVLRGQERSDDDGRDLLPLQRDAPLLADLRDQPGVARIHAQRHLCPDRAQCICLRNFGGEVLISAGEAHQHQQCDGRQHARHCRRESGHHLLLVIAKSATCSLLPSVPLCIVAADSRAGPPQGGNAKPPVWGVGPMTVAHRSQHASSLVLQAPFSKQCRDASDTDGGFC